MSESDEAVSDSLSTADSALEMARDALRTVSITLPYLAPLATAVTLHADERASTACIFASGRLCVNPGWFGGLKRSAMVFVIAHELMHLALRSHERAATSADARLFNIAHDLIINDILAEELDTNVPAGGLTLCGARDMNAEKLVAELREDEHYLGRSADDSYVDEVDEPTDDGGPMADALRRAGLAPDAAPRTFRPRPKRILGDDLPDERVERDWFPGISPRDRRGQIERMRRLAETARGARALRGLIDRLTNVPGVDEGEWTDTVAAQKSAYQPPWEAALQAWMEATVPGPRSFARPSRRGADRTDVVLPGRSREGWTLHLILDTSGSMADTLAHILGNIATFCEAIGVGTVHVLQCDVGVTADEWLDPDALREFTVKGYGGSDMTPALLRLADDPEVQAAIVLTDGYIDYPDNPPPFEVLWALYDREPDNRFDPPYGRAIYATSTPPAPSSA